MRVLILPVHHSVHFQNTNTLKVKVNVFCICVHNCSCTFSDSTPIHCKLKNSYWARCGPRVIESQYFFSSICPFWVWSKTSHSLHQNVLLC